MKPKRSLNDELKWAVAVMVGATLGVLVFGEKASVLIASFVGVMVVVIVRTTLLRLRTRRSRKA